jgi:hypothetical protein
MKKLIPILVLTLAACGHPDPEPMGGVLLTHEVDGDGVVIEVGMTVDIAELDRVMTDEVFSEAVATYDDVVIEQTYVNHIQLGYNPHGHGPPGVNDVPHFDIHFYGISNAERLEVSCDGQPVPEEERVPDGYDASAVGGEPFGSCVAAMGSHAGDEDSLEGKLDAELILGYDRGELIFIEPMISAARFEARDDLTLDIARPASLGRTTRWPDTFTMTFDEDAGLYRFALSGFSDVE